MHVVKSPELFIFCLSDREKGYILTLSPFGFFPLLKISLGNPYPKILYLAKFYVADAPIWV